VRPVNRADFLSSGAKAGAAVVLAGGLAGAAAAPALADGPPSDSDLAWVRIAVASELLAIEFYTQLIDANPFQNAGLAKSVKRALANEKLHYAPLAQTLTDAGQAPAVDGDFDYTFPKDTFGSLKTATPLGRTLETAFLGIYLGGVDKLQNTLLRTTFARIAASEAEHLTLFAALTVREPIGVGFPEALDQTAASDFLDQYLG
jgi:rubrerythrin